MFTEKNEWFWVLLVLLAALFLMKKTPKGTVRSALCDASGSNCQDTTDKGVGTQTGAGIGTLDLSYIPFPVKTFPQGSGTELAKSVIPTPYSALPSGKLPIPTIDKPWLLTGDAYYNSNYTV